MMKMLKGYIPIKLEVATRFLLRVLTVAVITVGFGVLLFLAAPKIVGGQSFSVLSNSMSPVVETGDMVVVVPQSATDIKVGQIVAFNDPDGSDRLFQHRVQSVQRTGVNETTVAVVTKGDANTSAERWSVKSDQEVGEVVAVIPKIGYATSFLLEGQRVTLLDREFSVGMLALLGLLFVLALLALIGNFRAEATASASSQEIKS